MPAATLRHGRCGVPVLNTEGDFSLHCPHCNLELLRSRAGQLKLRTKVLVQEPDGAVRGVCRSCGAELPLPLNLAVSAARAAR